MTDHVPQWLRAVRATVILAVLAATACGGGGGDAARETMAMHVDTIDGAVHIRHTGRAPLASVARTVSVGEAGGLDDASPAEFGQVRSVMADADGRFYVADTHAFEIRVFDPDGRFVRALGRKGGGPGEVEGMHGTAWLTPDTMMVVDHGNARLLLLDRAGRHLGQWPWMRATGSVRFFHAVGNGEVYAQAMRATGEVDGQRQRVESVWVRYTGEGPVDSVAIPQPAGPIPGSSAICRGEGLGFFSNPHGDRFLASPAPGGERVVAFASAYRLAFLGPAGDTVRVLTRDAEPVPLPDEDWRETAEQYAEFQQRWRGASCEGEIRRPRHRPILRALSYDHHGRLLVEHNTPAGPALDVYDVDHAWLATIPLPERDGGVPLFLRDDRLYLVARDTLGVQRVEAYGIDAPLRAGR
jgi:hypothetical protein